jgi:hypothetical protein
MTHNPKGFGGPEMKSSPENRSGKQQFGRFVFLPVLVIFALSIILTGCSGVSASAPSQTGATSTPATEKAPLSASPSPINFGTVPLNSKTFTSVIKLTNVGNSVETIESATIAPTSVFSIQGWTGPVLLNPGQTVQLQTIFAPKSAGSYSGRLTLVTAGAAPVEYVKLSGDYRQPGPSQILGQVDVTVTGTAAAQTDPPPVVGISVSPTSVSVQSGQSQQFTSAVTGTSNTAVTWTAQLGSISSSGVYTAPTVTSQTADTVSAISVADTTKYASAPVTVTTPPSSGSAYSLNPNSVTTKALPADVLSHCYGNTSNCSAGDAIAQCAMTDCGGLSELNNPSYMGAFVKATPGRDDFGNPVYYSAATDPWYSISAATPSGAQTVVFHAPNGALYSEGAEQELTVWDKSTGWVVELYSCCGPQTGRGLPAASSCGSTQATACSISNTYQSAAPDLYSSQDYGYSPHPNASNGFAPAAAMVWESELQNGGINHSLMFTVDCVNATTPFVFPATTNPGVCGAGMFGRQTSTRPSAGTLLFLDYTAEQIAGFNLPAWQTTLLTAFSKYGAYISETQGQNTGISLVGDENLESSESWKYSNTFSSNPFWPWITAQNGLDGTLNLSHTGCAGGSPGSDQSEYRCIGAILANIPRTPGPEGSDIEGNSCTSGGGCYPSGHIHVADVCVAKGFANSSGGCS